MRPLLAGDTDSERLLPRPALPADERPGGDDPVAEAYAATVRQIADALGHSSLNSMLVSPDRLYAVCSFQPEAEAKEEEPEYYRLRLPGDRTTPSW